MTNTTNPGKPRARPTTVSSTATRKAKTASRASAASKSVAKPVVATAPVSAVKPAGVSVGPATKAKNKLVRDSFTIPKSEYAVLEGLKFRAAKLTRPIKKSELLRAGIAVLSAMSDASFLAALNGVPSLKTGRPKGSDKKAEEPAKGAK